MRLAWPLSPVCATAGMGSRWLLAAMADCHRRPLAAALIDGLVKAGGNVLDIGCGPTPMLYFAGVTLQCDGAIQVTGSHNPPTHNGFKMVMNGRSFLATISNNLAPSAVGVIPV